MTPTNAERLRSHRQRQKTLGLCVMCAQPAVPGLILCETHYQKHQAWNAQPETRERNRERARARQQDYRERGLCLWCGAARADTGVLCEKHRDENRANIRRSRHGT